MYIQVQWDGLKTSPNNAWFCSQRVLLKMHEECALDLPQPDYLIHPWAPHGGTPSGQEEVSLLFSHPLAVLFLMSCSCQCALTCEKQREEQMTWLSGS